MIKKARACMGGKSSVGKIFFYLRAPFLTLLFFGWGSICVMVKDVWVEAEMS